MLFHFLSGALTMGFLIAGLFFLRFWKRTRDGLFIAFALAFWLLGLTQALLALSNIPVDLAQEPPRLAPARRLRPRPNVAHRGRRRPLQPSA